MNTLIITAHPSSQGFTHKIAHKFKEKAEENGHQIEILDLYTTDLKQDYLTFETVKEFPITDITKRIQNKISWANHLVFAFPLWWFDAPAIMKNFLDSNFTSGFAFKYIEGKSLPKGLLAGRTASVFITCDAPSWYYRFWLRNPIRKIWKKGRLEFCGVKIKDFIYFGNMRISNEDKRGKYLQKVEAIANKL